MSTLMASSCVLRQNRSRSWRVLIVQHPDRWESVRRDRSLPSSAEQAFAVHLRVNAVRFQQASDKMRFCWVLGDEDLLHGR